MAYGRHLGWAEGTALPAPVSAQAGCSEPSTHTWARHQLLPTARQEGITRDPGWQCQAEGLGLMSPSIPTSSVTAAANTEEAPGSSPSRMSISPFSCSQVVSEGAAYTRGVQLDPTILLLRKIVMIY